MTKCDICETEFDTVDDYISHECIQLGSVLHD